MNGFYSIIAKLLRGGRLLESKKIIRINSELIGLHHNTFIRKSIRDFDEMFDSLASILLQPIESSDGNENRRSTTLTWCAENRKDFVKR